MNDNNQDEMQEWNPRMEELLGKETWASLTYYQKMCEIAAVKELDKNFFKSIFGN